MSYCVYQLTNVVNGKIYVGKTNNIKLRMWKHFNKKYNGSKNKEFTNDKIKYGKDNFILSILEENIDEEEIFIKEYEWIVKTDAVNKGYNIEIKSGSSKRVDELIIQDYLNNGLTMCQLEKKYHTDRKRLSKLFKSKGIDTRLNMGKYAPMSDERYESLKALFLNGMSLRQIEREYHCDRAVLSKKLKGEGIIPNRKGGEK